MRTTLTVLTKQLQLMYFGAESIYSTLNSQREFFINLFISLMCVNLLLHKYSQ